MLASLDRLHRREPLLVRSSLACAALLLPVGLLGAVDPRTVVGEGVWVKPAKFLLGFAVMLATSAALLSLLPRRRWTRLLRPALVAVAAVELLCLGLQAARGRRSHFNLDTPFDEGLYRVMGVVIGLNMLLMAGLLAAFLRRRPALSPALGCGIRLGIGLFLAGCLAAVPMVLRRAHAVGAPEDGPGLPVVGWSTTGGDLRAPHFFGLHGLQVLPLVGWWLDRRLRLRPALAVRWTLAAGVAYGALVVGLWIAALQGIPLLPLEGVGR